MRYFLLALLIVLIPLHAYAIQRPVFSQIQAAFNTGGTRYIGFDGGASPINSSAFAGAAQPQASPGMVTNLVVTGNSAPGVGKSYATTLYRNNIATALTCTMSDTATSCTDNTHTVPYVVGDILAWQQVPTGTPSAVTGNISAATTYSVDDETGIVGGGATLSTTATNFFPPYGGAALTVEASSSVIIPTSGTIDKLYFQLNLVPAASTGYAMTVFKNGVATALTCSATAVISCTDLTHSFSVTAGDTLSASTSPIGAISSKQGFWSMRLKPTTDGEAPVWMRTNTISSLTRFNPVQGTGSNFTNEGLASTSAQIPFSMRSLYAWYDVAPGGAATRSVTLRQNGANVGLTGTATGASQTLSDIVNSVSIAAGDLIDWAVSSTGSPGQPLLIRISGSTYVAPPTGITIVDATTSSGASTALSCTKPAGTTTGDVVIAIVNMNSDLTVSDNNGGTPFTKDFHSANYGTAGINVFSRYAGGSEPSTYNFTASASGDRFGIECITFRGVDATNKYDVTPATANFSYTGGAGGTTATSTAITTVTNGAMVVSAVGLDTGTQTLTRLFPDGSFLGLVENSTNQPISAIVKTLSVAGTQASATWTYGATVLPGVTTFAMKPASTASTVNITTLFSGVAALFNGVTALFQ
jgi:hypothetical protein